ncbi:MAG TPA: alpha/beta hydrolase [Mycobacteriales bacterium]|nr:alpha/beta hydrolase [Mycobacteriales bacterium]
MRHVRARTRAAGAAVLAGTLLLAACSGGGSGNGAGGTVAPRTTIPQPTLGDQASPGEPSVKPVAFTDCTSVVAPQIKDQPGGDRKLSFDCGTVDAPLDYDNPDAGTVKLYLVRVRMASQHDRIGSLLINPGGPGGSGLDAAVGLALRMPTDVLSRFDLVGFDPRGVGLSDPVQCISDDLKDQITAADPDARTPAEFAAQVRLSQRIATQCSDKYGDKLAQFNTVETARDMDLIRRALGDQKMTYLGFSYGTLLGAVYAQLFPRQVRALVLDGAVDPSQDVVSATEGQARGFQNAFNQFAAACRAQAGACPLGSDPRAFVTTLMAKASRSPVPSSQPGEKRRATGGNVQLAVISALYDQSKWPTLSAALSGANKGDSKGVLALDDEYNERDGSGHFTNILDANITINCNDMDQRISQAAIRAKLADWRRKYPLFGPSQALSLLTCQVWQQVRHPVPPVHAAGSAPILVVGTVNDPATPYKSAQALSRELSSGTLLSWDGQGHTAYPKTKCVTSSVDSYLVNLTIPDKKTCPAH